MNKYKSKIVELFGEEHLDGDEEILETERQLKQKLKEALDSDSDEETQSMDDIMDLSCSDIEEEEEPVTLPMGRLQITKVEINPVLPAKALAQIKRQMEAKVTKGRTITIQSIPIVIRDVNGEQVCPKELIQDETEIIQQAERVIYGRNVLDATFEIMWSQKGKEDPPGDEKRMQPKSTNYKQTRVCNTLLTSSVTSTSEKPLIPNLSKAEKRLVAKKAWYKKKKELKRKKYQL